MAFISQRTWQFSYFSKQLGESVWRGKDVLDFGGNIGNMLRDPNSTIDEARYWCIDVDREAVERGRSTYTQARWIVYDRYCFFFNPSGIPNLRLSKIEQRFDYIVAFSVFTNTKRSDMMALVEDLKRLLKAGGSLAFTFIDPHFCSWPGQYEGNNLQWRLCRFKQDGKEVDVSGILKRAENADWCILVNGDDLYIENENIETYAPDQQESCYAYYTEAYMGTLFPQATILPPVNDEMHHCCIIKAPS